MSKIKVTLPGTTIACDGKSVSFVAPCSCTEATCLVIDDVEYSLVNALGEVVTGKSGYWDKNAIVTVLLSVTEKKAYVQNAAAPPVGHNHDDDYYRKTDEIFTEILMGNPNRMVVEKTVA